MKKAAELRGIAMELYAPLYTKSEHEIAMDANIDRRRAMVLQTMSAYEDTKMIKFIMNEL